jgi:hypothetical protein
MVAARFDNVVMMDNNKMAFGGAEHFSLSPPIIITPHYYYEA